ncbi:hypothetical protein EII22_00850 [Coriobacteriales bacterium OH1046]|nr:hypothetical protein EII22_00850 [Coriobacteriales bacterium OH1046]
MNDEASALLELQKIDLDLMRAHAQLGAMPQTERLAAVAQAKKKLSAELKHVIGLRKDIETDIAEMRELHAGYEQEQRAVRSSITEHGRSYKEVQALDAKLSLLAKQLEKLEFKRGPLLEKLAKAEEAEKKLKALGSKLLADEEALRRSFDQDSAEIQASIGRLGDDRADVISRISDDVCKRYAIAFKRFSGLAVERLAGNVPSACRVKLQADAYRDLERGPVISECPYCHRMLVREEP